MRTRNNKKLAVEVAKDVLNLLKRKKIVPTLGSFCVLPSTDAITDVVGNVAYEFSLQRFLKKSKEPCQVCGIGAIFVSLVNKKNKFNICKDSFGNFDTEINLDHTQDDGSDMYTTLAQAFSGKQIESIEVAFEGGRGYYDSCNTNLSLRDFDSAAEFNSGIDSPDERMSRIMKNIIKNGGAFKP